MNTRPRITLRLVTFAFAALLGIGAGIPVKLHADDTEIYLGDDSLADATRSNVLFILDTSGSMGSKDGGKVTRIDRMKEALRNLLSSINNVNVGLMRFTNPGGPILYPIAFIEAGDAEIATGGIPEVQLSIAESADDAEERQCTDLFGICSTLGVGVGDVVLDSPKLELVAVDGGDGDPIDRQVNSGDDDAEESDVVVFANNNSNQLELGSQGRITGMRFEKVDVPKGATITAAYLDFYSRTTQSGATTLIVRGHDVADSLPFPNAIDHIGFTTSAKWRWDTAATTAYKSIGVGPWANGDRYQLNGIEAVVEEIVNRADWAAGNAMTLLVGGTGERDAASYDDRSWRAPILHVEYTTGLPGRQMVGLRFQGVNVPQGVKIKHAYLELTPSSDASDKMEVRIRAEATGDAPAFTATAKNISGRTLTSAKEDWKQDTGDAWQVDNPVLSVDIATVVEEVVQRTDWCGGNSMAFVIEYDKTDGPRPVHSFDGDPSKAPRLVIDYDQDSLVTLGPTEGCMVQEIQAQVNAGSDDAEQRTDNSSFTTSGNTLEMTSLGGGISQEVGLRFKKLAIKPKAKILSATIEFTARDSNSGTTDLEFYGHKVDDADKFENKSNKDVTSRTKTSAMVPWTSVPAWTKDQTYTSPDLSAVVQEVVDYDWTEGNDMAFIIGGTGLRGGYSVDKSAGKAATLRIRMRGNIGSDTASEVVTVRQRLLDIVDDLNAEDSTPIVDTLYEAARYYRGEALEYGDTRNKKEYTRVSHPASYTGGTVVRDPKCTDDNLGSKDCKDETITGSPVYTSPIEPQLCQSNFIVLLTDGEANNNHSQKEVRDMTGLNSCTSKFSDGSAVQGGEECGTDLVKFLQTEDQSGVEGKNVVTTYTIGFNFSTQFLKDLAAEGGGDFYEASTSDQLTSVFNSILDDVQARTTSFATPALSVNAFNKLFHRNEVYFSLFTPGRDVRWEGNVKKYQLCKSTADGCDLGEVLDSRTPPLSAIGGDERIDDNAMSFWSLTPDGPAILEGGAGNQVPTHSSRRVFTYTDSADPSNVDLGQTDHILEDSNAKITVPMLGGSTDSASPVYMTATDRANLINWIRGQDVKDEDVDGDETDDRYTLTDPLHSSPVAVTYGGTEAAPVIKLFVGTNDGGLRMINGINGKEEWMFLPQSMLSAQRTLMANSVGKHIYGIDGTPTLWVNDENLDGIIDPSYDGNADGTKEFIRLFVGMRRGGKNYYAIDATPSTVTGPLTNPDAIADVTPTLLWRIEGNSADFPALGETWSQPKLTTMKVGTTTAGEAIFKKVLVFAAGYNDGQDSGFAPGGPGNAIYVVDPSDGKRLFWVSSNDHSDPQGVLVSNMTYPIPSDLSLMDSDGDGATDRIYVGDTGGQLWRVDIGPLLTDTAGFKATVGMLATVSDSADPADERKFFYPPDVVRVLDSTYSSTAKYDLVSIATGNRAHPLATPVQDRFYAFRDLHQAPLVDGDPADDSDDDGLADGYTTLLGKTLARTGDLLDLTNINDPQGTDLTDLQNAYGYFIDLEGLGEKGLSSPIVLAGTVFFTSYTPEDVLQLADCSLAEGGGVLYAFNVLNGAAVFNWDGIGDDTNLTKADRAYALGAGIPSSAVPIFQPEGITLLVGGGGGATTIDPDLALPRRRTYWSHE